MYIGVARFVCSMGLDDQVSSFSLDNRLNVFLRYEDFVDIRHNQDMVDGSSLFESMGEYPLVASGFFDSDGVWRFFEMHSEEESFVLEYDEFIEAVHETA